MFAGEYGGGFAGAERGAPDEIFCAVEFDGKACRHRDALAVWAAEARPVLRVDQRCHENEGRDSET